MRSGTKCTITSGQVHSWTMESLLEAKLIKDHGWLCTATLVLDIVLRAAGRSISVSAACRDLAKGPSDQAVMTAVEYGLPKTLPVLERCLNDALTGPLPRAMRRRAWEIAIDWHLHAVLWAAGEESQRTLLRPAEAGDHQVSRLRRGLYCAVRAALHAGPELGATPRVDGPGAAASGGKNPRNRAENQARAVGSTDSRRNRRSKALLGTGESISVVFSIVVRTLRVRKTAHGVCRLLSLRLLLIRRS
jgi:hypothetical protein